MTSIEETFRDETAEPSTVDPHKFPTWSSAHRTPFLISFFYS